MPTNKLTDIEETQKYLKIVYQHPMNVSKNFRKTSQQELDISLYLSNLSKEGSQLTH